MIKRKALTLFFAFLMIAGGVSCCLSQRPRKINVLFITCDALRADHLSCYGYERHTSSNIDKEW